MSAPHLVVLSLTQTPPIPHCPLPVLHPLPDLSLTCPQVSEPTSEVPDHIRPNHLIKELTKEIRYLEVSEEGQECPQEGRTALTLLCSRHQEEPVGGSKPVKSQGSVCGGAPNGFPAPRSPLERLCQARRARRAARRLQEQQRQAPKVPSNLDILERHTREVLRRLEVGPLEEVRGVAWFWGGFGGLLRGLS